MRLLFFTAALIASVMGCSNSGNERSPTVGDGEPAASAAGRIVILTNGDDPFWDACEAGATAAADEFGLGDDRLSLTFERADFTVERQVNMLRGYRLAGDVRGVGVSVVDGSAKAIADELEALAEAGIKVITIDGDVDRDRYRDARIAYLGTENIEAGRELGKAAAALQPNGGKVCTFVGVKSAANAVARIQGFIEGAGDKFEHIETVADGSDQAKARDYVRDALQRHQELDTLVGIWAYNAPACVAVAEDMDRLDDVAIYSVDAAELTIRAMQEGKLDVMVVQNPFEMGRLGVQMLHALVTGDDATVATLYPDLQSPDGDLRRTGLRVVVPEDTTLTADLFGEQTEFMTLPDFQAWLAEYGLKSS